ncbi:short-chain collagen C4-like [Mercenaria mercenaria]|uniref:short-chain collagen C4-like n=1 Tax=Mercenaria mercenaria TaxID=6596 RepID=UPI00234EFB89|nr:short-chain collagen C4-like [Mercenaria mercenaria]
MLSFKFMLVLFLGYIRRSSCLPSSEPKACYNKFEYEYNVLQKLVVLEEKMKEINMTNSELKQELNSASETINELKSKLVRAERSFDGSTYTRWGRTVCPTGATLVYDGYVAGGHYTHTGSGVNYLCLPKDPTWGRYIGGFQTADRIYGTEYYTADYPYSKNLNYQDVPCAVCRIPRNNVLMIPGRNKCHKDYILEYSGYLMGGHYSHAGASEYVCVDDHPETLEAGRDVRDEKYFYYVQAACGGLKCPPYVDTRELTCAVCSFSPAETKSILNL